MPTVATSPAPLAVGRGAPFRLWLERLAEWLVDSRSHRVICLVVGIWLLNAFDLVLTILAHQQGLLHEQNPLARELLRSGPLSLSLYKIGLVLLGSFPLIRYRTARITELGALVVLVAYSTLAVHWSACYQLYCLTATHNFTMAEINAIGGLRTP